MSSEPSEPSAAIAHSSTAPAVLGRQAAGDTIHNSAQDSVVTGHVDQARSVPLVSFAKETGVAEPLQHLQIAKQFLASLDPAAVELISRDTETVDPHAAQALVAYAEYMLFELKNSCQHDEWYYFRMLYLKSQSTQKLATDLGKSEQEILSLISEILRGFRQKRSARAAHNTLLCWGLSGEELQQLATNFPDLLLLPQIAAPQATSPTPLLISSTVEQEFLDWYQHQEFVGQSLPPIILLQSPSTSVSVSLRLRLSGMVAPGNWARLSQLLQCRELQASEGTAAEAGLFLQLSESLEIQCRGNEWLPPAFWRICPAELADHIRGCPTCRNAALNVLRTQASSPRRDSDQTSNESDQLDELWDDPVDPDSDPSLSG